MKKIVTSLLAIVLCIGAHAQIVSTTSSFETVIKEKKVRIKPKLEWYAKVGLNLMSVNWGYQPLEDYLYYQNVVGGGKIKAGFNIGGGFISHFRPLNPSDFYWGAEIGLSQVGGGLDSVSAINGYGGYVMFQSGSARFFSMYCGPGFGWMRSLSGNMKLDVHFNPELMLIFGSGPTINGVVDYGVNGSYDISSHISHPDAGFALRGGIGVWYKKINVDLSYRGVGKPNGDDNCFNNFILSVGYAF